MELKYGMMGSSIAKALEIREVYGFNEVKSGLEYITRSKASTQPAVWNWQ